MSPTEGVISVLFLSRESPPRGGEVLQVERESSRLPPVWRLSGRSDAMAQGSNKNDMTKTVIRFIGESEEAYPAWKMWAKAWLTAPLMESAVPMPIPATMKPNWLFRL